MDRVDGALFAAYLLMATGLPLTFCLFQTHGALWTLAFLTAGASILRWPLYFAWRWVRGLPTR